MENTKCYCCAKASTSSMDVDGALNELGMLSTVTESSRQYLKEKQERVQQRKNLYEKALSPQSSSPGINAVTQGIASLGQSVKIQEASIPHPCGYQILTMNTNFVTGLTSTSASNLSQIDVVSPSYQPYTFGLKFQCDYLDSEARTSRQARMRLSRARRFRKPYDIPWRQALESHSDVIVERGQSQTLPDLTCTPDRTRTHDKCNSNSSTPEKSSHSQLQVETKVYRSRSLDDLKSFQNLKLGDNGDSNFVNDSKEMENMSKFMNNLSVEESSDTNHGYFQ